MSVHRRRVETAGIEPAQGFRRTASYATSLLAQWCGRREHRPELTEVIVRVTHSAVTLELPDGERLVFDAGELRYALGRR